jgi:hypothetical protein
VIELHFKKGGSYARRLPSGLLRPCPEAGRPERQPAEEPQPERAERDGYAKFATQSEENGKPER